MNGMFPDMGPAIFHDEPVPVNPEWEELPFVRDPTRKYSLRKRFLYERNRIILDKSKIALVIQPMSDQQFKDIMERLQGDFYTSNFRNGLIHIHDKPYAKLKGFFRGPVKVLLQDDPDKCFPGLKKFYQVMKEYPTCMYLGGAYDGAVGLAHELEELLQFDSKNHVQCQLIGVLNSITEICPVVDHATASLARVMHHHAEQIEKKQE
jgi:ribosomal protein L10